MFPQSEFECGGHWIMRVKPLRTEQVTRNLERAALCRTRKPGSHSRYVNDPDHVIQQAGGNCKRPPEWMLGLCWWRTTRWHLGLFVLVLIGGPSLASCESGLKRNGDSGGFLVHAGPG